MCGDKIKYELFLNIKNCNFFLVALNLYLRYVKKEKSNYTECLLYCGKDLHQFSALRKFLLLLKKKKWNKEFPLKVSSYHQAV